MMEWLKTLLHFLGIYKIIYSLCTAMEGTNNA